MTEPGEVLEWDSMFFGKRIARARTRTISPEEVQPLADWCVEQSVDCLYFLADGQDAASRGTLAKAGFVFVDVRMTLTRTLNDSRDPAVVPGGDAVALRTAIPTDLPDLARIARVAHGDSRFFVDTGFGEDRARGLFDRWIAGSVSGELADVTHVAADEEGPIGYLTCSVRGETGSIGLLGVDERARGRRVGTRLIQAGLRTMRDHGAVTASVVTQGTNIAAQRAYQTSGFRTADVSLWYHRWFNE